MNFCSLLNPPQFFFWFWLPVLVYNSVRVPIPIIGSYIYVLYFQAILALFIVKGTNAFRVSYDPTVWHLYRRSLVNFLASVFLVVKNRRVRGIYFFVGQDLCGLLGMLCVLDSRRRESLAIADLLYAVEADCCAASISFPWDRSLQDSHWHFQSPARPGC
jgi:hypothetical protein